MPAKASGFRRSGRPCNGAAADPRCRHQARLRPAAGRLGSEGRAAPAHGSRVNGGIDSITQPTSGPWAFELDDVATSDAALRQLLHGLPGVGEVGERERAAGLATRSIKKGAKLQALDMAVRMVDLTTLEGADTPGKIRAMCAKARRPDPSDLSVPPAAT